MKRIICSILMLNLFLSGCSVLGERIKDPVVFYYVREEYQQDMDSVIGSEIREASGHRNDLSYLLALYTMGPSKETLRSPLPKGTTITTLGNDQDEMLLELSDASQKLTDAEYTLAAACLARTCWELTDTETITVVCGDRTVSITKANLLLLDPGQQIQAEVNQ